MPLLLGPLLLALVAAPRDAEAVPVCRAVETQFTTGTDGLQMAVWIEDLNGKFIDTTFITRTTGQFGLANRPGEALLKTDLGYPYGRREMVMPVWAHRRGKHYPRLMMGGICGNSPLTLCPDKAPCGGDCEDSTIAYHSRVSSWEGFYCSPSGPDRVDVLSCASKGTFSKGAFADSPAFSLYPPRADLTSITAFDAPEAAQFAPLNDLVVVSGATPKKSMPSTVTWYPPNNLPDGEYVLWLETSQESDFNASHNSSNHPNKADSVSAWDFEGHPFLGQPSILYRVPFRIDGTAFSASTKTYAGYSSWDGKDGTLHSPDTTITLDKDGSGLGRLLEINGARLSVTVGGCAVMMSDGGVPMDLAQGCEAPAAATALALEPGAKEVGISWNGPAAGFGAAPAQYEVRYHEGSAAITDENFATQLAPTDEPPAPGAPGARLTTVLRRLMPSTAYTVAVRSRSLCGKPSPVVTSTVKTTQQMFAVLHGCFVATAAYGSPEDRSVDALRRFRDKRLLTNPVGQLLTAVYYATSPSLAAVIAGDTTLRELARRTLAPLVDLLGEKPQ